MIVEAKKESLLWKINKMYHVVADSITEAEEVFHKHYNFEVNEIRKVNTVLL